MEKWTEHHHRIASALDVLLDSAERALAERDLYEIAVSLNDMIYVVSAWETIRKALNASDCFALTRRIVRVWGRLNLLTDLSRPTLVVGF